MKIESYTEGVTIIDGNHNFSIMENNDNYICGFNYRDSSESTEMVINRVNNPIVFSKIEKILNGKKIIEKEIGDSSLFIGIIGDDGAINITTEDGTPKLYISKESENGDFIKNIIDILKEKEYTKDEDRPKEALYSR